MIVFFSEEFVCLCPVCFLYCAAVIVTLVDDLLRTFIIIVLVVVCCCTLHVLDAVLLQ